MVMYAGWKHERQIKAQPQNNSYQLTKTGYEPAGVNMIITEIGIYIPDA